MKKTSLFTANLLLYCAALSVLSFAAFVFLAGGLGFEFGSGWLALSGVYSFFSHGWSLAYGLLFAFVAGVVLVGFAGLLFSFLRFWLKKKSTLKSLVIDELPK
jgi:hypothetical protein